MSKEIKAGKTHVKDEISEDKKKKIKIFVKDYMDKVMVRRAQKKAKIEAGPGPSDSVSSLTPQAPESTPRERHVKDGQVEIDTPVSRSLSRSPERGGEHANGDIKT